MTRSAHLSCTAVLLSVLCLAAPASGAVPLGSVTREVTSEPQATAAAGGERLTLSRTSGRPGQSVAVQGLDFPRGTTVRLRLGGRGVGTARTDRRGSFAARLRVPRLPPGRRTLSADAAGRRIGVRFRVLTRATVSLSASSAAIGQRVSVRGRRFPRRAIVSISLSGRRLARARTGRRGRFAHRVRIRSRSPGRHVLLVVSGRTRVRRAFTVLMTGAATPQPPARETDPLIAAAGDIACDPTSPDYNGGSGTSATCRQGPVSDLVVDQGLARVLTLGDHQYEDDALDKYQAVFHPTWGRVKPIISPVPGNHEYFTPGAAGYFDYFNGAGQPAGAAGERSKGYYSYDIGAWHVVALNSNCEQVACSAGSAQQQWLQADLAGRRAACTLAYFHHPRFSSAGQGDNTLVRPLWQTLYDANADVILTAHAHIYERFAPQTPDGVLDPGRGIRQFTVGTGGRGLHTLTSAKRNSEVRHNATFGVLRMRLHSASYEWEFVPEAGKTFRDGGSQGCH